MSKRYFQHSYIEKDGTVLGTQIIPWSKDLEAAVPDLAFLEIGEAVKLEAIEMTQEQYDSLPEFQGY